MTNCNRDTVERLQERVAGVLDGLGLRLSPSKTRIAHLSEGIDFLGFTLKWRNNRGRQVVLRHDDLGQGVPDHQADPPEPDPSPVSAPSGGRDRGGQRRVARLDVLLPARAGRAESRTAGTAGGPWKRNDGNVVTAPRADPTRCTSRPTPATGSAEPGFSKERRLDPQITLGLLTAAAGFPLMVEASRATRPRPRPCSGSEDIHGRPDPRRPTHHHRRRPTPHRPTRRPRPHHLRGYAPTWPDAGRLKFYRLLDPLTWG
jgi:hypothetical protein